MSRNLITGGMGLVGNYLARQLLADGEEVVLFEPRAEFPHGSADLAGRVEIAGGDVGEWVHVLEAVSRYRVNCIYHCAAVLSTPCEASPASGFRTNVVGTMNVLEAARLLGVPDVMFVGPGRQITHHYGDWSGVVERAAQGRPYTVHADPDCPCAYIYVKDAVRALLDLRRADPSLLRWRMYNVHGFMATLREIAAAVRRHLPEAQIAFEWDKGETMRVANRSLSYEMDTTAASEDFGYTLRYPLEAMVVDFIGEVRAGKGG